MSSSQNATHENRLPITARTAGVTTAGLWGTAVMLYTGQAQGDVPIGDGIMQLSAYWLLAAGCTIFWWTFMRIGEDLVDADWHIAYELDPEAIFSPGRDRELDRILTRGLAADRPPTWWPPRAWRAFALIGAAFWAIAAVVTIALASHWWALNAPHRGVLLALLLVPAVHCTAAGKVGPGLTRMLELREAARQARQRLCTAAQTPQPQAPSRRSASVLALGPREIAPPRVRALHNLRAERQDCGLRIVRDNSGPRDGLTG